MPIVRFFDVYDRPFAGTVLFPPPPFWRQSIWHLTQTNEIISAKTVDVYTYVYNNMSVRSFSVVLKFSANFGSVARRSNRKLPTGRALAFIFTRFGLTILAFNFGTAKSDRDGGVVNFPIKLVNGHAARTR